MRQKNLQRPCGVCVVLATYCCSWICVSASISFLGGSFVCLFCSNPIFYFILFYFYFWDTERIWVQMGGEELGGVGGVKDRICCMKKIYFLQKKKKRNSDENTVWNSSEKWQVPSKDKRSRDGCGKENWRRSCHVRCVDETESAENSRWTGDEWENTRKIPEKNV